MPYKTTKIGKQIDVKHIMMPKYIIKLLPDMSQAFRNFTENVLKIDAPRYVIFIPLNYDGNKRIAYNNYSE